MTHRLAQADEGELLLQNWWYTTLLNADTTFCPPLQEQISCDVVVVGAGMAGLHAALKLAEEGKDVVLIERNICGGSSTGKSAGFLTPDSELELHQIVRRYGLEDAKTVWSMASHGVDLIVDNVKRFKLRCDLLKQDSLFLGVGSGGAKAVREEERYRDMMGYPSTVYDAKQLCSINPGKGYSAGIRYGGTYGINPLMYAQGLKEVLIKKGVRVYEGTAMTGIAGHVVTTHLGSIHAENIILCIDKMRPTISKVAHQIYHAQTFLSISEPLSREEIAEFFPSDDQLMCWDSELVYCYYRLTGDHRLLLGGGSAFTTFSPMDVTKTRVIDGVLKEFRERFPFLEHHEFIQYWPGRIDTTKDLIPIVDRDPTLSHVQYVLGCVGLPWATFCGDYAARKILEPDLRSHDKFLRLDRSFIVPLWMQRIFGKMFAFSMNNLYSKYFQKDVRVMAGMKESEGGKRKAENGKREMPINRKPSHAKTASSKTTVRTKKVAVKKRVK